MKFPEGLLCAAVVERAFDDAIKPIYIEQQTIKPEGKKPYKAWVRCSSWTDTCTGRAFFANNTHVVWCEHIGVNPETVKKEVFRRVRLAVNKFKDTETKRLVKEEKHYVR